MRWSSLFELANILKRYSYHWRAEWNICLDYVRGRLCPRYHQARWCRRLLWPFPQIPLAYPFPSTRTAAARTVSGSTRSPPHGPASGKDINGENRGYAARSNDKKATACMRMLPSGCINGGGWIIFLGDTNEFPSRSGFTFNKLQVAPKWYLSLDFPHWRNVCE